jgi:hypothetical protein
MRDRLARIVGMKRALPALLCLGVLASACGKGGSLAALVDIAPPTGYTYNASASGGLDRTHAAIALPYTVTDDAKAQLGTLHYKRGNVKVWTDGTAFASATALRLGSAADATKLFSYEEGSIKTQGDTAYVSAFPPLSGASVFIVSGVAKGDQRDLFCQGVFFARAAIFYVATTCNSANAEATTKVTALAKQLAAKAAAA